MCCSDAHKAAAAYPAFADNQRVARASLSSFAAASLQLSHAGKWSVHSRKRREERSDPLQNLVSDPSMYHCGWLEDGQVSLRRDILLAGRSNPPWRWRHQVSLSSDLFPIANA